MAVTQNSYTGNGSTTNYSFTFPYLKDTEVKASIDATVTTAFDLANATTVQFNTAPANGAKIKIYRETDTSSLAATFYAGSAIKSEDLNDNFTQNLYTTQEVSARYLSNLGGNMVGDLTLGEDVVIKFEGATDNDYETTLTVVDPTNDRTITLPNVTGTVITTGDTGTVSLGMLAGNSVNSSKIVDGSIVNADINASAAIAGSKLQAATGSNAGTISAANQTKLDGIATSANNYSHPTSAGSKHIPTGGSAGQFLKYDSSGTAVWAADNNTTYSVGDGGLTQNNFTNTLKTKLDGVETGAKDDQTASEIKTLIASSPLDASHLAANSVTTSELADAELTTLAGMQSGTASKLASSTALTADIADLNQVDGLTKQTTISDSDASFPTSGAVVDYVSTQISGLGGLTVIANDASFPNTQPDSGLVISIADAGGLVINGSGTSTTARTVGGSTVTINNINSQFNSSTLAAGIAMMVTSTGSGQIYNYHKATLKESDIVNLSTDINDFSNRYRVASSAPTSDNDAGDLYYNTTTNALFTYNAVDSTWEEAQSIGNFYINTISSYSGTGGNSATFNGSAYRFVLSNAPANSQQLIVSINGVIQKPNAGTSQPSEGYAIDGSSIIFSAAPPTGSDYFIITIGSSVNTGTPSDNTVSTATIQNLAVTGDKIATNLDLADNKKIRFGTGNDLEVYHDGSHSRINATDSGDGRLIISGRDGSAGAIGLQLNAEDSEEAIFCRVDGSVDLHYDGSKKLETTSSGVTVTGGLIKDGSGDPIVSNQPSGGNAANPGLQLKNNGTIYGSWRYDGRLEVGGQDANATVKVDPAGNIFILNDSGKLQLGASQDLKIYHDGTHNYWDGSTGVTYIRGGTQVISLQATNGEHSVRCAPNAEVQIYHDNVLAFETTSGGIRVYGPQGGAGEIAIYADQGDDNADKWKLKMDGSNVFRMQNVASGSWENAINAVGEGQVELCYDGTKKFETGSYGAQITGDLYITAELNLGGGSDADKYLDAQVGTNALTIRKTTGGDTGHAAMAYFKGDAECALYYNGTKRAYTTDHGFEGYKSTTCLGRIGTSTSGHYFESQSDDTTHGFEIYQKHGSNTSRASLAVYDNRTGSKELAFYVRGDGETFSHPNDLSDRALKDNITDMATSYTKIKNLRPVNFNWKGRVDNDGNPVVKSISGFIAQEVEEQIPNIINGEEGSKGINSAGLVAHLTKALQEAITKIETLETKVAALEAK